MLENVHILSALHMDNTFESVLITACKVKCVSKISIQAIFLLPVVYSFAFDRHQNSCSLGREVSCKTLCHDVSNKVQKVVLSEGLL